MNAFVVRAEMTCEREVVHGESCEIQKRFRGRFGQRDQVARAPDEKQFPL